MQSTQPSVLSRLARVNPLAAFLATLVLVLVALWAPGIIGGGLLLSLAVGLAALLVRTWPVQHATTRVARTVVLAALVVTAFLKILL